MRENLASGLLGQPARFRSPFCRSHWPDQRLGRSLRGQTRRVRSCGGSFSSPAYGRRTGGDATGASRRPPRWLACFPGRSRPAMGEAGRAGSVRFPLASTPWQRRVSAERPRPKLLVKEPDRPRSNLNRGEPDRPPPERAEGRCSRGCRDTSPPSAHPTSRSSTGSSPASAYSLSSSCSACAAHGCPSGVHGCRGHRPQSVEALEGPKSTVVPTGQGTQICCEATNTYGRGGRIRTAGLLLPKQARCQAALRPVWPVETP